MLQDSLIKLWRRFFITRNMNNHLLQSVYAQDYIQKQMIDIFANKLHEVYEKNSSELELANQEIQKLENDRNSILSINKKLKNNSKNSPQSTETEHYKRLFETQREKVEYQKQLIHQLIQKYNIDGSELKEN